MLSNFIDTSLFISDFIKDVLFITNFTQDTFHFRFNTGRHFCLQISHTTLFISDLTQDVILFINFAQDIFYLRFIEDIIFHYKFTSGQYIFRAIYYRFSSGTFQINNIP